MTTLAPKRPTEIRRYVFDFADELAGDPMVAYQVAVTSGTVTVQDDEQISETCIVAFLVGGQDGQTSTLEIQVTSRAGQLLIRDYSILTANALNATGLYPSSSTKGQIMNMAFEEITLAGYEFDATPAEQASALQRLDSLMAMWAGPGVNLDLGYNFPTAIGGSAQTDLSGVPDFALDAVVIELAQSIAPVIGKALSIETRARKAVSMRAIRAAFAFVPCMEFPALTIRGAGAKPLSTWRPFMGRRIFQAPKKQILGTEDGNIIGTEDGVDISA